MKETVAILSLLGLLLFSCVYAGFTYGRYYEKKIWKSLVPDSMNALCIECAEAGMKYRN